MKKVLLFLLISITMLGFTQAELLDQVSNNLTDASQVQYNNVQAEVEMAKQEAKVIATETKNKEVDVETYDNTSIKNDIEKEKKKNENLYTKYMSVVMNKDKKLTSYGYDIISGNNVSSQGVSISKDYILGSGDIVSIKVWSELFVSSSDSSAGGVFPMEIGKNGNIFIPNVGTFSAVGKSIASLEKEITLEARKKIKSLNVEIALEKMREISVFVTGEVNKPGYIRTISYANIIEVLNMAGGINSVASLRNIKIFREGKEISVDLYEYFSGKESIQEIKIKDGDTVFIPVAEKVVLVDGEINKPAYYELKNEKNFVEIIKMAGDFGKFAFKGKVEVYTVNQGVVKLETLDVKNETKENIFKIHVNKIDEKKRNDVFILGAVINPNAYSYEDNIKFSDLLIKSGGFMKESIKNYATIIRGQESRKAINFNPEIEDIKLEVGDEIYVYNYEDVNNKIYASINGSIMNSGSYEIFEGSRALNLIFSAGGIDDSKNPFMQRADIYRVDNEGKLNVYKVNLEKLLAGDENENILLKSNDVLKIFTYEEVTKADEIFVYGSVREPGKYRYYSNMSIEDIIFYAKGIQKKADTNVVVSRNDGKEIKEIVVDINRNPDFKLLEGDIIFVRKKAEWSEAKLVTLEGNVKYPGTYQLYPGETMKKLIDRAGGFTKEAYPEGLQFTRENKKVSNFEYNKSNNSFSRDIELLDKDIIYIPERPTTVKIEGEVYTPGYIVYDSEMDNYKDYVEAAGGYKETAYKSRTFVIKANGKTVAKPSKTKIEPGDTIYVPLDAREKKGIDRGIELFKGTLEIVSTVALIILLF